MSINESDTVATNAAVGYPVRPQGSRKSMVDEAYRRIKKRILTLEYPGGFQALEEDLAIQLGMSRTPVREALIRLENEGFVEVVPRRGMRVRPLSVQDITEIYEVLTYLEVAAVEMLARRRLRAHELVRLEKAVGRMDKALAAEDLAEWGEADTEFHRLLVELCGNSRLARVALNFQEQGVRIRMVTLPLRSRPVYSNVNHAAVIEAVRRGDPETAREIHLATTRRWGREMADLLERHRIREV
ncbi:MAG: GntR family transcriptional regulator [Chloroflexota bacterium]